MHVLYIVPYVPFGKSIGPQGPKNFSGNILEFLSKNTTLDLIIICDDDVESIKEGIWGYIPNARSIEVYSSVKGWRRKMASIWWGLRGYPLNIGEKLNAAVKSKLRNEYKNYDIVHFDFYQTVGYRKYLPLEVPCIITAHDAYSLMYRRAADNCHKRTHFLGRKIREWLFSNLETSFFKRFTRVLTVSPIDKDYLTKNGLMNVRSIPIPVKEPFLSYNLENCEMEESLNEGQVIKLLFSVPIPLDWYLNEVRLVIENGLTLILDRYPNLEIVFWGEGAEEIRKEVEGFSNVSVIDYVRDYEEFLKQNWIFVYPRTTGAGLHTKVQEAMAFGLPIVGYSHIMDAFSGENGVHYYSVQTNSELIEKICLLLDNYAVRCKLVKNAKLLANQQYSLDAVGDSLLRHYTETISNNAERNR